jgi:hypothetical protein
MSKILAPERAIRQEKLKGQLKAKRSIRAIDQGTLYDIPGKLRHLARAIENGEVGSVRNGIVLLSTFEEGSFRKSIKMYAVGPDSLEEMHWMVATLKNRLEPS